jgi:2-C-methyl-D-erythritol 4-phosphate cytidylyltransferase
VARLREAIAAVPNANRYVIRAEQGSPSPSWGGSGRGSSVTAYGRPVSDTCKEVVDGLVRRTVPRESLVTTTGPWVFSREALTDGLARIEGRERDITGLVDFSEAARLKVRVVLSA